MELTELIANAPWREAVTYRDTWPHEYVLTCKDNCADLVDRIVKRWKAGEGVKCRFFRMENTYLFIGDYKYWIMVPYEEFDLEVSQREDYVLNRAPPLPGPPRLRNPTRRHGQAGGLPSGAGAGGVKEFVHEGHEFSLMDSTRHSGAGQTPISLNMGRH